MLLLYIILVQFIHAKKAVVSNASMWDTLKLLPKEVVPKSYSDRIDKTPQCESFMHLHLGFDAEVCHFGHWLVGFISFYIYIYIYVNVIILSSCIYV